jgi:hypothetical protein
MGKRGLLIGHRRRGLSSCGRNRQGGCGRNNYMCGGTESAPGVRNFRRRMYVGDLERDAEKHQESTAKNQREFPGASHEIFALLTAHHY